MMIYLDICGSILQTQYNDLNNPISDAEVQKVIKELQTGKACGGYMLINELYIYVRAFYYQN